MKKVLVLILLCFPVVLNAQTITGIAPAGSIILYPGDSIESSIFGQDSVHLDIDCDSIIDFSIFLVKGNPSTGFPNSAYLFTNNSNMEFCRADTLQAPYSYVWWYDINATINCPVNYSWTTPNPYYLLGRNGSIGTLGPAGNQGLITDSFFAFKKNYGTNSVIGWVNINLNLPTISNANPYLVLNSYTSFCEGVNVGTQNNYRNDLFKLSPTLINNQIHIDCEETNFSISLINQFGQSIYNKEFKNSGQHRIDLPDLAIGHYFVRYNSAIGSQVIRVQKY